MFSDLRVDPTEFKRCVGVLNRKLDEVALRAGVPDSEWTDLESTLASLPPFSRDRVAVMLQGIHVQAQNEFPAMAFAANYVLRLAHEVGISRLTLPLLLSNLERAAASRPDPTALGTLVQLEQVGRRRREARHGFASPRLRRGLEPSA